VHDVCIENIHVVFAVDRGGIVGEDGSTHNGLFDFCYLRSLPNMVVMAPGNENDLRRMLLTAINHNGPISLRYPRGAASGMPIEPVIHPLSIGKGKILQHGDDILILAIGSTVCESIKAHSILSKNGISATVVDCRFVKPLDVDMIASLVKKIPRVITVEENVRQGGFGSAVIECLSDQGLNNFSLMRLGIPDVFVEHGSQDLLRSKFGIDSNGIINAAQKILNSK
jgi:1-deoxy-D-xylulose-5-phosphate synthase